MAPVVTMRQLLESGVHFGHQTRRWNPKMKRFILAERNGIYIIDLQQSLDFIDKAYEFIKETVAHGGTVLYVGTKKQAQEAIAEQASRVGMPFVNHRWLGGMLTNFSTVYKRLQRMKELEAIEQTGAAQGFTKKETLQLQREKVKLTKTLRVSAEGEVYGLDLHEHGISAYPEYVISALNAPAGMTGQAHAVEPSPSLAEAKALQRIAMDEISS